MITEERMRALMETAAGEYRPPDDGPARVKAALAPAPRARGRSPALTARRLLVAGVAAMVALTAGIVVVDRDAGEDQSTAGEATATAAGRGRILSRDEAVAGGAPKSVTQSGAGASAPAPAGELTRIVKTGSVGIEVSGNRFDEAVDRVTALAVGAGGYVSDSKTSSSEDHDSGTMSIRVPADRFESVLEQVGRLGKRQQTEVGGRDVTAEYTDIEARLRVLTTSRESLLQVLGDARAVGDILAVQDRLNAVQTEIEQLEGRRRVLDDQVAFATLAVSISEPGEREALLADDEKSSWRKALDGFTGTFAAVLAASGTALAVVLLASALLALAVIAVRWARHAYARLAA